MPESGALALRPVGVVRSAVAERKLMPVWGCPASIEVFEAYEAALERIDKHTHLWILGWLDQGRDERDVLRVTPRGVRDLGPEGLHGVFSVRSPARPNPIGLTVARMVRRTGRLIELDRLDFLDGTPVVDIKPYFATRDMVFSANCAQVGRPRSREELRESLHAQALNFHGAGSAELELAVRIYEHYRAEFHDLNDPSPCQVRAPLSRPVLVDALMAMARATPGRGTLVLGDGPEVTFGGRVEYTPAPDLPSDVLAAADRDLFSFRLL